MRTAGFSINGMKYPSLSFGPECVAGEQVFLYSDLHGNWTLSTMDLFRDQA